LVTHYVVIAEILNKGVSIWWNYNYR